MSNTVYILGAGASHYDCIGEHLEMPLANDFFQQELIIKYWSMPDQVHALWNKSNLYKIISRFFAGRKHSQLNIEEVYSFILSSLKNPFLDFWDKSAFINAEIELLQYIWNVLSGASIETKKPRLATCLLNTIEVSDSIISFNWDNILDSTAYKKSPDHPLLKFQSILLQSCHKHSEWYSGELFGPPRYAAYIKIHGSINLAKCENNNCIHATVPYRCAPCDEFADFYRCSSCGHNMKIFLLPPHTAKSYALNNYTRLQAAIAADRLIRAEHIVIIGYSFPAFDAEAQALFRSSRLGINEPMDSQKHLKTVTLVDPAVTNEEFTGRVKDILGLIDSKSAHGHAVRFVSHKSVDAYLASKKRIQ